MEPNVDAWLNGDITAMLDEVLGSFIEEYLTSLSSNAKNLSPSELYEAIHDVYKSQLKTLHQLGKGISSSLQDHTEVIQHKMKKIVDEVLLKFLEMQKVQTGTAQNLRNWHLLKLKSEL